MLKLLSLLVFIFITAYHDDYVIATCGGNGIEQHAFHHMECPLDDDSGFFLLGKWVGDDELHLTGNLCCDYYSIKKETFS